MMGPIYAITDPDAPRDVVDQALAAARGGAWAVQLRDKLVSDADLVAVALRLHALLRPLGVKLIINDRLEVAQAADADGLHIGQGDGAPEVARTRLGAGKLLGLSVEARAQCAAIPDCIDYIGVGPVRATATKPDHAPPLGMEGLAAIIAQARIPAFAIGGIGAGDAPALKHAGAIGMAVVTAISRAPDPEAATRALRDEWSEA
ncbi:MAG: thiamine phosphate synthase [Rhodobacteraceae bacterium]|nr:MAG: thiamine phosphate synthase [Paracoccaceae bacterium]